MAQVEPGVRYLAPYSEQWLLELCIGAAAEDGLFEALRLRTLRDLYAVVEIEIFSWEYEREALLSPRHPLHHLHSHITEHVTWLS